MFIGIVFRMEYYCESYPIPGRVRSGEYPFAIGVLEGPDSRVPNGIAFEVGQTADGFAKWKLKVRLGADVHGASL